jgi:phosphoserine phosphatase RsbU/P
MSSAVPAEGTISDRNDPHLQLHCVFVFVRDQDRSLRFFLDTLGFNLIEDKHYGGAFRWVAVAPPDGTALLALLGPRIDRDEYELIGRSTGAVFVTDDIGAKFQDWSERGVRFHHPPRTQPWGGTATTFEDPDGNSFVLAAVDELTRQLEVQRRAIAQKLEHERCVAHELEIARMVQARLFPQRLPAVSTLDYAGVCIQARHVGGDYYDFLNLGPQRLGLVIGDISGKGIAAALLMANLQANLRGQCALASDEPHVLLRSVNQLFCENTSDSAYATLFFAEYDDRVRRLRYASCGHLPALLLRHDNTVERLDSTGPVLGLFEEWDCTTAECDLFPGDTLALYTDGITESFSDTGEEFGEERLADALRRHRDLPSHALLASIVDDVQRFSAHEQFDDITLTVAKCREV